MFWITIILNFLRKFLLKVYLQTSGTIIGTKLAPPYVCIFMDKVEAEFFKTQNLNSYYGLGTLTIFIIQTNAEEESKTLMDSFNNYKSNLKFTYAVVNLVLMQRPIMELF